MPCEAARGRKGCRALDCNVQEHGALPPPPLPPPCRRSSALRPLNADAFSAVAIGRPAQIARPGGQIPAQRLESRAQALRH
eukprot:1276128-Pyramimonas_sp.AAC.1